MNYIDHYTNKIICGNALKVLKEIPGESINCCVCSPPYWSLRDYGVDPVIWDGDKNCEHEWGDETITLRHKSGETNPGKEGWFKDKGASDDKGNCFCLKCGAWRGSLGLEPTFDLYIKHLCDIFDEVKRVLRKDGTCFVNIGDSYAGSGKGIGTDRNKCKESYTDDDIKKTNWQDTKISPKSLCDIPYRFSIEMTSRGWIKRNTIIWYKKNCMPSSANDRFTVDFEYLFFFTKNNKAIFWTNEKTLECVGKSPLGIKGIEGKDWEWRPCPACSNKNYFNYRTRDVMRKEKDCPQFKASNREKKNIKDKICPRCKGLKKVKHSLWSGHDYWFDQQFEPILADSIKRELRGNRPNKYSKDKHLPKRVHPMTMSQVREYRGYDNLEEEISNRQGRNKRCVWTIPTQPFPEAHFAVYPEELIEVPIKAGCPEFICKKCGKARVKIYKTIGKQITKSMKVAGCNKEGQYSGIEQKDYNSALAQKPSETKKRILESMGQVKESYYTDCGCNAGFEPGIVLDQFMGSGTSALVALKQRKRFIGIDIKQEYIGMAKKRIHKVQQELI